MHRPTGALKSFGGIIEGTGMMFRSPFPNRQARCFLISKNLPHVLNVTNKVFDFNSNA